MANLPALTPTTFAEAMQFAQLLAQSTMVPISFQKNPANIVLAVQWGAELGMPPLQALNSIAVINGRPSVYGDTALALVLASVLCEDVIEHFEGNGNSRTAICEARRKGRAPVIKTFSVDDAIQAGLWGRAGPWKQYPDRMLQMRARGFALRDAFPDVLRGVITAEEAADIPREPKDITPPSTPTVAAELDAFVSGTDTDFAADQAEVDPLLAEAHSQALQGYETFRAWYLHTIDDDKRTALRPHIKALQEAARAVPNQGEVDMGLADDREAGELVVQLRRRGRGYEWSGFADDMIARARQLDPMHIGELRLQNARKIDSLRIGNREQWERMQETLTALERGEDTKDERQLKDEAT